MMSAIFIDHDRNGRVHFFGNWMSRDEDFVAPIDAQQIIIKQWKRGVVRYGDSLKPYQPEDDSDWYY